LGIAVRILFVTSEDETIGGVAYVVGNLARQLKGRGHNIFFLHVSNTLFPTSKTTRWGFSGFELNLQMPFGDRHPIVSLPLFLLRFPIGLFQLIRLVRKYRIQIVNIHYPAECFFYFAICRRLLPIRLITSVHGADLFPGGLPLTAYPKSIKWLLDSSDRIVTPSNAYREDVASVFPQLRSKIVSIHNGVNLAELGIPSSDSVSIQQPPYILCVAMHNEKKGIDVLLRAFALLHDKQPSLRLVLAGDGPLRGQLEDLSQTLGIAHRVEFLGRQGRTQVAKLVHGCEIFVLPSRSEPFGIVLAEAMACKKPVVATTVGGIPEIIENGGNGILVDPDDDKALAEALIALLRDETLRTRIATRAFSMVREQFHIEKTGKGYEALFADLITDQAQEATR
jgi:glycosyltransferase involved in cell wall biosynthesis